VTVAVEFDDFLDPETAASDIRVALTREGRAAPAVARTLHESEYIDWVQQISDSLAVLDSIDLAQATADAAARRAEDAAVMIDSVAGGVDSLGAPPPDSMMRDSLAPVPPDTVMVDRSVVDPPLPEQRARPPRLDPLQGSRAGLSPDGRRLLPGRRIVLLLDSPLDPGVEYQVEASGVVNIFGLGGGGGTAAFSLPVDSVPLSDTVQVDTLALPDTGRLDTLALPDTGQVDTLTRREPRP
jgi:hypothetical protein